MHGEGQRKEAVRGILSSRFDSGRKKGYTMKETKLSALLETGKVVFLDGGLGTMLQAAGMPAGSRPEEMIFTSPDKLVDIHKAYLEAGADIICTNTFGANGKKLEGSGLSVEKVVAGAVECARRACEKAKRADALVALDIGPLGEMLEPVGTLGFDEAYGLFKQVAQAGAKAGADLIIIETMADLYEIRAALLAAKENTNLPVIASMTFEQDGRTFAGTPVEAAAITLQGLGADALGINCSLGPKEIMPLAGRLCGATSLPVFLKPNAGLPDPSTGEFLLSPKDFCQQISTFVAMGISMVGGCCGTTPGTIRLLKETYGGQEPHKRTYTPVSRICSSTKVLDISGVCPVGERINPTGKKRLQEALKASDFGYIQSQAVAQQKDGAKILDINVGAPGVDEVKMLPLAVKAVQAVSDLPLQLDSSNPDALEAALRVVNGKPIVNSTTGEQDKMDAILPLCKKYGAAVVGLALDQGGIPDTAQGRVDIASKILENALSAGIPKQDVYIDCLVLSAGAEEGAATITLEAVRRVKQELGLKTMLGVSNISYGLPSRQIINRTFLAAALQNGLDMPILNPATQDMMETIAAYELLTGIDAGAVNFVEKYSVQADAPAAKTGSETSLSEAVERGLKEQAADLAKKMMAQGTSGMEILDDWVIPALDRVGQGYETGKLFLPQMLSAAGAAQSALAEVRAAMGGSSNSGKTVVVATVQGDVHDIGKNIAKVLLENYGYNVIDLGRDVPPQRVVEAVTSTGAKLAGLSALMTTTLPSMEKTIQLLKEAAPYCRIMVGGAVLTEPYAMQIGADYYSASAKQGVDIAKEIYGA